MGFFVAEVESDFSESDLWRAERSLAGEKGERLHQEHLVLGGSERGSPGAPQQEGNCRQSLKIHPLFEAMTMAMRAH